jgi:hypothetical protein
MGNLMNEKAMHRMQLEGAFSYALKDFLKTYFLLENAGSSRKRNRELRAIVFIVNGVVLLTVIVNYALLPPAKHVVADRQLQGVFESDVLTSIERTMTDAKMIFVLVILLRLVDRIVIFQPITRLKILIAYLRKKQTYEDAYAVRMDEQRITVRHPREETALAWDGIDGKYEYREGFIYIDNQNQAILLLPKRAFADIQAVDQAKHLFTDVAGKEILPLP